MIDDSLSVTQEDMSPFLKSPMPGTVVSVAVSVGDTVSRRFTRIYIRFRHRLHEYSGQSTRFHDIETASKTYYVFEVCTRSLLSRFPSFFECECISKPCTRCEVHNVYSLRAIQFRGKVRNGFQIDAVSPFTRPMKSYCFENDTVSISVSIGAV